MRELPVREAEPSIPDPLAAGLRGFGPVGILVMIAVVGIGQPWGALLVLAWAWRTRTPWRDLGFERPRSWLVAVVVGIAFGIAFKLVMKAIVMPLLGADPVNRAYQHLVGNPVALPGTLFQMIAGAGFGEETVFRGFLFERFDRLFGRRAIARAAIVVITSTLFAALHYQGQGITGVQQAMITGLVFGTIFAITGRLWMLIVAHAAFDVTAVFIIYWNLESHVAHLIFR